MPMSGFRHRHAGAPARQIVHQARDARFGLWEYLGSTSAKARLTLPASVKLAFVTQGCTADVKHHPSYFSKSRAGSSLSRSWKVSGTHTSVWLVLVMVTVPTAWRYQGFGTTQYAL